MRLLSHSGLLRRAMLTSRWLLALIFGAGICMPGRLAADIGEKANLADQEPQRVAAMRAKLVELLKGPVQPGQIGNEDGEIGAPAKKQPRGRQAANFSMMRTLLFLVSSALAAPQP